jgi:hypothetical protein
VYTFREFTWEFRLTAFAASGAQPFDKEWKFLCACASPLAPTAHLSASTGELDWNVVLELAVAHGVPNLLAARLKEIAFAGVPPVAREKLQNIVRAQHVFTLALTAELLRILDEFQREGIAAIPVKGPVVSLLAHGDPGMRNFADLDLVVGHKDILAATRLMGKLQFEAKVPEAVIRAGKIPGEYQFARLGTQQIVELHTENTLRYYPRPMPIAELFARQRRLVLEGKEIPAFRLEDEFVFDCIHGTKDFWERLMWPADIAGMVMRHPQFNWAAVRQAGQQVGAERMVRVALLLAESLLGAPVPAAMAEETHNDATASNLVQQIEGWMPSAGYAPPSLKQRAMFRLQAGGGGLTGAGLLLRLSLSPTEEDWGAESAKRSSGWWEAAKRPFRLMRKYGQGG